jgi:hypothetical protein
MGLCDTRDAIAPWSIVVVDTMPLEREVLSVGLGPEQRT